MNPPLENDPLRQLAESTEESAVRQKYDVYNAKVGKFVSVILVVVSTIGLIASAANGLFVKFGAAVLLLTVAIVTFALCTSRSRNLTRLAGRNLSGWIVSLVVLQLLLLGVLALSGRSDIAALGSAVAWSMLLLWMPFARRISVHVVLVSAVIFAIETRPAPREGQRAPDDHFAPVLVSHFFALLAGGLISRRKRQTIVADWADRSTQAKEQLRMRDELQFAREVQLSMLPEAPPSLPWIDIAGISLPATEVGGDYYDYFRVDGGVALVCGDIAGHGLASGIVLTALRSGFMLLRESLVDPAAVLTRLHELVDQTSRRRMLATAAVAMIDPIRRTARIASAGHPPVMFRSNGTVRAIELFGPPLGVRLPIVIAETEVALAPGDVLVLHSDGVYETANDIGELYGLDRLAALIARSDSATATELRDAILRDVTAFRGTARQADDVTVVVARMT